MKICGKNQIDISIFEEVMAIFRNFSYAEFNPLTRQPVASDRKNLTTRFSS